MIFAYLSYIYYQLQKRKFIIFIYCPMRFRFHIKKHCCELLLFSDNRYKILTYQLTMDKKLSILTFHILQRHATIKGYDSLQGDGGENNDK